MYCIQFWITYFIFIFYQQKSMSMHYKKKEKNVCTDYESNCISIFWNIRIYNLEAKLLYSSTYPFVSLSIWLNVNLSFCTSINLLVSLWRLPFLLHAICLCISIVNIYSYVCLSMQNLIICTSNIYIHPWLGCSLDVRWSDHLNFFRFRCKLFSIHICSINS